MQNIFKKYKGFFLKLLFLIIFGFNLQVDLVQLKIRCGTELAAQESDDFWPDDWAVNWDPHDDFDDGSDDGSDGSDDYWDGDPTARCAFCYRTIDGCTCNVNINRCAVCGDEGCNSSNHCTSCGSLGCFGPCPYCNDCDCHGDCNDVPLEEEFDPCDPSSDYYDPCFCDDECEDDTPDVDDPCKDDTNGKGFGKYPWITKQTYTPTSNLSYFVYDQQSLTSQSSDWNDCDAWQNNLDNALLGVCGGVLTDVGVSFVTGFLGKIPEYGNLIMIGSSALLCIFGPDFSVQYQIESDVCTGYNWYGTIELNEINMDRITFSTGQSDNFKVMVGDVKIRYRVLDANGKVVNVSAWDNASWFNGTNPQDLNKYIDPCEGN